MLALEVSSGSGYQVAPENDDRLVWCFRNPLNSLGVIPGKLAIARPGIQEN